MSIFTVNLTEHFKVPVGAVSDVSKIGKVKPPSVRAKGIEYDVARRASMAKPKIKAPKIEAPKLKAPPKIKAPKIEAPKLKVEAPKIKAPKIEAPKLKVEAPKIKAPKVEAPKLKVEAPPKIKAPEPLIASPKVIDDLKIYTKDLSERLQNTVNAMEKAKTAVKLDDLGELGKVAKQIDESGSVIPKGADGSSMVKGKVEADEIASNLKKLELDPPKDIDDAAVKIKKTSEDRLKEIDQKIENPIIKKTTEWVKNNKLLVGGIALAATIAGGIAIAAAVKEKEKTDAVYNIISIDDISTSSLPLAKITFTPSIKLSKRDYLMFSDTNCNPPLPPECEIYQIDSDFQVQVIIREKLKSNGTSGTMKIKTSFGNQFTLLLTDSVKEVASIGGDTAGAIAEGAGIVTKEVAGSFWEGLGLPNLTSSYWWIILVITLVILCSSSLLALYFIRS